MKIYKHLKSKQLYLLLQRATNATNIDSGKEMIIYAKIDSNSFAPMVFVRDAREFEENFEEVLLTELLDDEITAKVEIFDKINYLSFLGKSLEGYFKNDFQLIAENKEATDNNFSEVVSSFLSSLDNFLINSIHFFLSHMSRLKKQ